MADIKLKKNSLEENKAMLGTKLSEVSIKEKAILKQLVDVKNYLVTKIEARFNELNAEVSKAVRGKKKAIQGRKDMLHKHYLQTDYALAFADFTLASGDNHALVVSKKLIDRQFRRLKKLDPSTGLSGTGHLKANFLYIYHLRNSGYRQRFSRIDRFCGLCGLDFFFRKIGRWLYLDDKKGS